MTETKSEIDSSPLFEPQAELLNAPETPLLESDDEDVEVNEVTANLVKKKRFGHSSNQSILTVTAVMFTLFLIAEIVGALASNSLSLLADAASMLIDVFTYFTNMYAERVKQRGKTLTREEKLLLRAGIPLLSVISLVGVTVWISVDAVDVLLDPAASSGHVDIFVMYGFAAANFVIDVISVMLFVANKDRAMYDQSRSVSTADGAPYGHDHHNNGTYNGAANAVVATSSTAIAVHRDASGAAAGASGTDSPAAGDVSPPAGYAVGRDVEGGTGASSANGSDEEAKNTKQTVANTVANGETESILRCNVNMMSALSHVSADTLRTFAIFAGAVAASCGANSVVADAWAALVCSVTIVVAIVPLLREIADVVHDYRDPSRRHRRRFTAGHLSTSTSNTTITTQGI